MKKSLVYLACPYSHPDPEVRESRFLAATHAAATLTAAGVHVFSPITQTHPILLAGDLPRRWEYWEAYDRAVLSTCRALVVLQLEGWDCSEGVRAETAIAEQLCLPCYFTPPGKIADVIPILASSPDQPATETPEETASRLRFAARVADMLEKDDMSFAAQWVRDRAAEPQP